MVQKLWQIFNCLKRPVSHRCLSSYSCVSAFLVTDFFLHYFLWFRNWAHQSMAPTVLSHAHYSIRL